MKHIPITVFDQTYLAAEAITTAMNATLPPTGQVDVRHVLGNAVGIGIATLCEAWKVDAEIVVRTAT